MSTFTESGLIFTFPKDWVVKKYDEHRFYGYLSGLGFKGVDMIALTPDQQLILIEVKNYNNRFPQDGIDPTETLLNNISTFSEQYKNKFEDTFRLLSIVQKFFQRKKWVRWFGNSLVSYLPYKTLIRSDWGFWTMANKQLKKKQVLLVLWLEVSPDLPLEQINFIHENISGYFQQSLPIYPFLLSDHYRNNTQIIVNTLN